MLMEFRCADHGWG